MRTVAMWKLVAVLAAVAALATASSAEEVKIGISASITGPFSFWGKEYKEEIDIFLDEVGGKAGNNTMSIIYRDVGGQNPPRARQLAQELVLRDKVAILGGHELTPNVLAVTDVINQAKLPFVIFNTGTAIVTDQSPYFVRPTYTNYTHYYPLGRYAGMKGLRSASPSPPTMRPGRIPLLPSPKASRRRVVRSSTRSWSRSMPPIIRPISSASRTPRRSAPLCSCRWDPVRSPS